MLVIKGSENIKKKIKLPVLTIGNFDGVHLGHQEIFKRVIKNAKRSGGTSVVYTFDPHPVKVLAPSATLKLLQTTEQKIAKISEQKIDICIIEPFTREFSKFEPEPFFEKVILKRISPAHIIVGHDLTFGKHRSGTIEMLETFCKKHKIKIDVVEPVFMKETLLSSTQIRNILSEGKIEIANKMLGKPYTITGKVVKGHGFGRELGFHTANLSPDNELIPLKGVYITKTLGNISVTNVGYNPTFGENDLTIETHILNYSDDLYGKNISITFYKRLRDEKRYENHEALKKQIQHDINEAKRYAF